MLIDGLLLLGIIAVPWSVAYCLIRALRRRGIDVRRVPPDLIDRHDRRHHVVHSSTRSR
jgi:hypothetical protein